MKLAGLILAGGQGRRMGHLNKGLVSFGAGCLVDPVVHLLKQHCDYVAISANQDLAEYEQRQVHVWPDEQPWQESGPLAGIMSSVPYFPVTYTTIQVVPCDTPFLNSSIVQKLSDVMQSGQHQAVYARTPTQEHPVIFQFQRQILPSLHDYLMQSGKHSIRHWLALNQAQAVDFDDEHLFINMNDKNTLAHFAPQANERIS